VKVTNIDGGLCTGVIVNATHVLTAAHCEDGEQAQYVRIRAGIASANASANLQLRNATALAIHPYYNPQTFVDDVAVLTIPALSFSGPYVKPIPVARRLPPAGTPVRLFGWGSQGNDVYDGYLHSLTELVITDGACGLIPITGFCAVSKTGVACRGDSGGPLVTLGAKPTVIGLDDLGSYSCTPDSPDTYVNLTMPEVRDFVFGDRAPPKAPRGPENLTITTRRNTVTCHRGRWSGNPTYTFTFALPGSYATYEGKIVHVGRSPTFTVPQQLAGQSMLCGVTATNAGGSVWAAAYDSVYVEAIPRLTLAAVSGGYRVGPVYYAVQEPVTLTITNSHGRVVRQQYVNAAAHHATIVRMRALPSGRYKACLTSSAFAPYLAAKVCIRQQSSPPQVRSHSSGP
jgi:hypothetical protein